MSRYSVGRGFVVRQNLTHRGWVQYLGKIFVEGNVLLHGANDLPSLLVQPFTVPARIDIL